MFLILFSIFNFLSTISSQDVVSRQKHENLIRLPREGDMSKREILCSINSAKARYARISSIKNMFEVEWSAEKVAEAEEIASSCVTDYGQNGNWFMKVHGNTNNYPKELQERDENKLVFFVQSWNLSKLGCADSLCTGGRQHFVCVGKFEKLKEVPDSNCSTFERTEEDDLCVA